MRRISSYLIAFVVANLLAITAMAQSVTVSGNIKNSANNEATTAVSVTVKGGDQGTFTDDKGNFSLSVKKLPVTLIISSVGFELQEITVSNNNSPLQISFKPASTLGQDIVVSATRVATGFN